MAKDVGGDGRVDALTGQQRGTGMAQRVGRDPWRQAGTVDDLAQQPPEVPEANRLPVRRREDQGVVFGTDVAGQMAVEVRRDRRRKSDSPAPVRLAIRPDEMATDLDQSLDHQHAAIIAKMMPTQGERLVRAQSAVTQEQHQLPVAGSTVADHLSQMLDLLGR